jgi:hypothetical protein
MGKVYRARVRLLGREVALRCSNFTAELPEAGGTRD